MFEESVENFIVRWASYVNNAMVQSHIEGSPLVECQIGKRNIWIFERTSPYAAPVGPAQVIVNPMTQEVEKSETFVKHIEVTGISQIKASGVVLQRLGQSIVLDTGIILVVNVMMPLPNNIVAGDCLEFISLAPIHGFILPPAAPKSVDALNSDDDI